MNGLKEGYSISKFHFRFLIDRQQEVSQATRRSLQISFQYSVFKVTLSAIKKWPLSTRVLNPFDLHQMYPAGQRQLE